MGYKRLVQHGKDSSDIPASVDIVWDNDGKFAIIFHATDDTPTNYVRGERIVIDNMESNSPSDFQYTAVVKNSHSKTGYSNITSPFCYPLLVRIQDALEDLGVFDR